MLCQRIHHYLLSALTATSFALSATPAIAQSTIDFASTSSSSLENGGLLQIEVLLSSPVASNVQVPIVASGSALAGVDFNLSASPLVILAGASSGFIDLTPLDDALVEGRESLSISLGVPTGAVLGTQVMHEYTLLDDEPAATVAFTSAMTTSAEGAGAVDLVVQLSAPLTEDVQLPFVLGGTALVGVDYTVTASPLVIAGGQTTAAVTITPIDDGTDEPDETIIVDLGAPSNAVLGAVVQHSLTLTDDDSPPLAKFLGATGFVVEGGAALSVTVALSEVSGFDVTLPITTSGSAPPSHYLLSGTPVFIPAGSLSGSLSLQPLNNGAVEGTRVAVLTLTSPTGATLGSPARFNVRILDDETVPTLGFLEAVSSEWESEPSVQLEIQLSSSPATSLLLPFSVGGTATDPDDYTIVSSPLVIPAGATSVSIDLSLVDDANIEPSETVVVTLGAPSGATLAGTTQHTFTLLDDDSIFDVDFAIAADSRSEGAGQVLVEVTLSGPAATAVSVPMTFGGSAQSPADFTTGSLPLVFGVGQTSAFLAIDLVGDSLYEHAENIVINLGTPTGANLGSVTQHNLTISDDDPLPAASFTLFRTVVQEIWGGFTVRIELDAVSGVDAIVPFSITGPASGPTDLIPPPNPAVIPAGQSGLDMSVGLIVDRIGEAGETVTFLLDQPMTDAQPGAITSHLVAVVDGLAGGFQIPPALTALQTNLDFGLGRQHTPSGTQQVGIVNLHTSPITFLGLEFETGHSGAFDVSYPGLTLPVVLAPAQSLNVEFEYTPVVPGNQAATYIVRQGFGGIPPTRITVEGTALGPVGSEVVMNSGIDPFISATRGYWSDDFGSSGSDGLVSVQVPVVGTLDDTLYQTSRVGADFDYSFALDNGWYDVRFRSWEPIQTATGTRVFDVTVEGQSLVDDLDIFAQAGVNTAWMSPTLRVELTDGVIDIEFDASVGRGLVSALEIRAVPITSSPTGNLAFGTVDQGHFGQLDVELVNTGLAPGLVTHLQIVPGSSGSAEDFTVDVGGTIYAGASNSSTFLIDLPLPAGQSTFVPVFFTPTSHTDHDLTLVFDVENGDPITIPVTGSGGANPGWGFLHPVIAHEPVHVIDYDLNGSEIVEIFGHGSHTHEAGHTLVGYEWQLNGMPHATTVNTVATLPMGSTSVALTIADDHVVPATATLILDINVYAAASVPGVLAEYFDGALLGEVFLLDNVPAVADHVARQGTLFTGQQGTRIGASQLGGQAMVQWTTDFSLPAAGTFEFVTSGGDDQRVIVDGQAVTGPTALAAGPHTLVVRFAASDVNDLPLQLSVLEAGLPVPNFEAGLTHAEGGLQPIIHAMPSQGTSLGGNNILIEGFGFFPENQVVVNWGGSPIDHTQFTEYSAEHIRLVSPPGSGVIQVSITTPNGTTSSRDFTYSATGPVPVAWSLVAGSPNMNRPTRGTWGPDGRMWVTLIDGSLRAISYDDDYAVTNVQFYAGVNGQLGINGELIEQPLGIAFNPFEIYDPNDPTSLRVYVAHSLLFQDGGHAFAGRSEFHSRVSILTGPNFDVPVPLITGLPVSNHDHGINGLEFDANGDLLIAIGGNTNAGVKAAPIGDLHESPFSGAILKAFTSRPNFNGFVQYVNRVSGAVETDQVMGDQLRVMAGVDIEVYASGMRNVYDLVTHTNGYIYGTDNGPNNSYGPASTGATTQGPNSPQPDAPDEFMLIERGNYYGHPNRTRGLDDDRQNVYYDDLTPSIANEFTQRIALLESSTNGIEEYRATTFNSRIRGQLAVVRMTNPGGLHLLELSPDGRNVISNTLQSPVRFALDVATAPGGALITVDYWGSIVRAQVPVDVAAIGLTPYDVHPGRGPVTGGMPFIIGGSGFGAMNQTSVTFDGVPAVLSSVTAKRIRGTVPARPSGLSGPVTVTVSVGANSVPMQSAFNYLPAAPALAPGRWFEGTPLPTNLGEVACVEHDGVLYVFGEGDGRTFAFDALNGTWNTTLAQRPFQGNHHGCEIWNDRIYLIGGLGSSSDGRVQIYDPALNVWSLGAQMPWSSGSAVTALIADKIYVAGGIVGSSTVANMAVYDPALNTWTGLGAMPLAVNHAAASTDGQRMFIFGGRQGPNIPQVGFSDVQVYDPVANTWQTSSASQVAPMPLPRGGTGKAIWYRGEFYVFGGEDTTVAFDDVQAYNPVTDSWRLDANMPTARHGVFPVLFQDRVFLIGGGIVAGFSASDVVEVFKRL